MSEGNKICKHEWVLIDTDVDKVYNGFEYDFQAKFIVGCRECNVYKVMDEIQLNNFRKWFDIVNIK